MLMIQIEADFKCDKCDLAVECEHKRTHHLSTKVNIEIADQKVIAFFVCEYRCRLNIQLRKHTESKNKSGSQKAKYSCEKCEFSVVLVTELWRHVFGSYA
jgi:hypothetical protein